VDWRVLAVEGRGDGVWRASGGASGVLSGAMRAEVVDTARAVCLPPAAEFRVAVEAAGMPVVLALAAAAALSQSRGAEREGFAALRFLPGGGFS
jgi:hypothetical protein